MVDATENLDQLTINTIRALCMDAVQKANSGHPGAPMGLAPAAYVLFKKFLKHHPQNPAWIDRDRFVLSGGHASSLLYSLLYLFGYGLDLDDLKNFRQWGSRTPGHPEYGETPGVETTTGPLGQGIANAVGMAIAESHLAARFNKDDHALIDHHTFCMCGDGDLMEGVAMEAVSLAGHLGLGKLILIYDDNQITIEGATDIAFTENVADKFTAMNWHVTELANGNDLTAIQAAIQAGKEETDRPSLIKIRTHIAYGSPNKQDTADAHGAPLGDEEIRVVKKFYGLPEDLTFHVPEAVLNHTRNAMASGENLENGWQDVFSAYKKAYPEDAALFVDAVSGFLTKDWDKDIPEFSTSDAPVATRAASGKVLNAIAPNLPSLMGGSADLAPSNKTYLTCSGEFQKNDRNGRNIRFGVREHAMGAVLAGMYLHSGVRPYGGTFLVFADYMRPAIRLASLMNLPLIYVFTHDSVAVGEDGPTHQPVEHLAALRAIPGLHVVRPADANETAQAWKQALTTSNGPTALILSRQKLPVLDMSKRDGEFQYGAYAIQNRGKDADLILIATGSEVHISLKAAEILEKEHHIQTSVVSMPSWEWFEKAPAPYRARILPSEVTCRLAVEAGIGMGWEKYVGQNGAVVSIERFGASAPGGEVLEQLGMSVDNVVNQALSLVNG
ncbi:transketolase [Desulfotignum phosphitoxidans]|uniref:Transketolase n=1 Tax=Desulfotignum phosphitoxidans DSM 13687 TaxID=1286635 RepID=S0G027_9BACT|nr:transketolase [Desulfotignum phosphitoxidans]EMS77587.1 transketolase Tkt [Desulfotignum phosphitoxidans DSM 13687]